jgi:hypothetical protein
MPRRMCRRWPSCLPRPRDQARCGSFAASRPPWPHSNSLSAGPGCVPRRGSGPVSAARGSRAPTGSLCLFRVARSPWWPRWAGPPRPATCLRCCRRWRTASSMPPPQPGRRTSGASRCPPVTARVPPRRPAPGRRREPRPRRRARPARRRARRSRAPAKPRARPKPRPAARATGAQPTTATQTTTARPKTRPRPRATCIATGTGRDRATGQPR